MEPDTITLPLVLPIETDRLVLRALTPGDAVTFAAYRDDPDVARHQEWELPYTIDAARRLIDGQARLPGPTAGEWFQIGIAWRTDPALLGDVAVGLDAEGRLAQLGYTVARRHQRQGVASEAAAAIVDALFARGVHRVAASLDPANVASAALLRRLGFRYEGCAVQAAWVRGEWCDDDRYALLASEHQARSSRSG